MKTREEVEHLKRDWMADGPYDLESVEGFEEYHDELLAFSQERSRQWEETRKQKHEEEVFEVAKRYSLTDHHTAAAILALEKKVEELNTKIHLIIDNSNFNLIHQDGEWQARTYR